MLDSAGWRRNRDEIEINHQREAAHVLYVARVTLGENLVSVSSANNVNHPIAK